MSHKETPAKTPPNLVPSTLQPPPAPSQIMHIPLYDQPLITARLIRRYKRFLADVVLPDGLHSTAHCANSGSMLGLCEEGSTVWLSLNTNPKAKLEHRWEVAHQSLDDGTVPVGINTSRPNAIVHTILEAQPELLGLQAGAPLTREVVTSPGTRLDLQALGSDQRRVFIEVKNVTLRRPLHHPLGRHREAAEFPDARTRRGTKHLLELTRLAQDGHRAVLAFCVQRDDTRLVRIAEDIDPCYAEAFAQACARGVQVLAFVCAPVPTGVLFKGLCPVDGAPESRVRV